GGQAVAMDLGERDLAQVAPTLGVAEVILPFVDPATLRRRLLGPVALAVSAAVRGAEVVAGREGRAEPAEDYHPHVVVGLGLEEGRVQVAQETRVLGVTILRAI